MNRKIRNYFVVGFLVAIISGCSTQHDQEPLKIAISKAVPDSTYINYINWLMKADSTIICLDMYHLEIDSAIRLFSECDGLLLTGGTDIYPGRYGKEHDTSRCWESDFKRDSLELLLVGAALDQQKPVLGICRGLQLLNVYLGGSLYIDLPSDLDTLVKHQCSDKYNCYHPLQIVSGSHLFDIAQDTMGIVNSDHHQGIDRLSGQLEGSAFTDDGLIEAIHWRNGNRKPYLFGVQWHPERMDFNNPVSGKIAKRFIHEVSISAQ
jgi:putative glutamine amidotransferase